MKTNDLKQMLMGAFIAALVMMFLVLVGCHQTPTKQSERPRYERTK